MPPWSHHHTTTPRYVAIAHDLENKIASGELAVGDQLSPIRQLTAEYDASTDTIQQALRVLRQKGRITSTNQGTFVAPSASSPDERLHASQTGQDILRPGESAVITGTGVDSHPTALVLAHLSLAQGQSAGWRSYVIYNHAGVPVTAGTSWFRPDLVERCPRLLVPESIPNGTTGAILEATGIASLRSVKYAVCVQATDEQRRALDLEDGAHVLLLVTSYLAADGTTTEYAVQAHPAEYAVNLDESA